MDTRAPKHRLNLQSKIGAKLLSLFNFDGVEEEEPICIRS